KIILKEREKPAWRWRVRPLVTASTERPFVLRWTAVSRQGDTTVQSAAAERLSTADRAMARYASGDDAAFGDVYDAVAPALHRYLARRTRDAALTDDLVQHTFLKMHRNRHHFHDGAEVMPWAFAIGIRLLIDRVRRDQRAARIL